MKSYSITTLILIASITKVFSITNYSSFDDTLKKHIYSYDTSYRHTNTLIVDIIHTTLYVKPIWDSSILKGKAEILLKPYFYSTNKIFLNARGMRIHSIKINDAKNKTSSLPFTYKYENDSIKILLSKTIPSSQSVIVTIDYTAQPEKIKTGGSRAIQSDKGLYFINPKGEFQGKMPQIWTQGETQSNSVWFPTVDSPNEKMTHDIYITVGKKYTTLSNGILVETKQNPDGSKTDHWKMNLPHAPYLVMLGIGEFKKVTDKPWKGKEISYYVEPAYESYAKAIFGNTYKMIDFFSNKLGVDYAWQKYAQIVVRDYVSGAMENTSATLHGEFLYQTDKDTIDGVKFEDVISHELFHQWFGDLVTCESWSNLPLNESFATYGEYLWEEFAYGRDAADEHHYNSRRGYIMRHKDPENNPPLIRFNYDNREDMFDGISYNKGGQVLHMLRKLVGDSAFFKSLQLYLTQNMFKPVEIHHLRLAFEETTGQDLNWFFNQWFMYGGHPSLQVQKSYDEKNKILSLTIKQEQNEKYPLYRLPLYIDIYTSKEKTRHYIDIYKSSQTFTFSVNEKPLLVNFDAERQLLAEIDYTKTDEELMYQFQHAPLWMDRFEAIQYLKENLNDEKIMNFYINVVLKDKYKGIRLSALEQLSNYISKNNQLKEVIINMAKNDPSARVRAKCISILSSLSDSQLTSLFINALEKEKSSDIISSALYAIYKIDPTKGIQYADKFQNDNSKAIILAVSKIYSETNDPKYWEFFKRNLSTFTGFEAFGFFNNFNKYVRQINNSGTVINIAKTISAYYYNADGMVRFAANKILNDLLNDWKNKQYTLENAKENNTSNNEPTKNIDEQLQSVNETVKTLETIAKQFKNKK
ncbi:MAG: hypothetical protein OHK0036_08840 [Bacteroidia bacterium]